MAVRVHIAENAGNLTNVNHPTNPDLGLKYDDLNRVTQMIDGVKRLQTVTSPAGSLTFYYTW
jgi:YD repeat-containing protein